MSNTAMKFFLSRAIRQSATLISTPRTPYMLQEEYTKSIGASNTAMDFSAKERGAMKHK